VADEELPQVGDVFMTGTLMFVDGDHATLRPVVVVRAPARPLDYVTVLQRSTTATTQPGIDHPKDPGLALNKDGRWVMAYHRAVRCDQFLAGSTKVGRLHDTWLEPLVEAWEQM
jgi:hypothetical protein